MPNEQEKFLKDLEQGTPTDPFALFEDPAIAATTVDEDDPEMQPDEIKNRRHKRLEEKLQAEREANIQLTERLKVIAETKQTTSETADYLKTVERIYGTDTPEAIAATELLKQALRGAAEEAKREALETVREEQRQEREAQAKEESELDSILEELEDEYGIDLTSATSETKRKGFFKMLEKMSPKDSEGNVLAYADPKAVWEFYQSQGPKKPDTLAKDLASRTMTQSGASVESKIQDDATVRYLKEHGII